MNAFESMIGQLHMFPVRSSNRNLTVSKKDYDIFYKEFVFSKLKGESLGKAFCKRFGLDDFVLQQVADDSAKLLIETLGYIKE